MDNEGNTALHFACQEKNVEVVRHILLCTDRITDIRNNEGLTPLLLACSPDRHRIQDKVFDVLELLVDAKCDVTATTRKNETAMILIVKWVKVQCRKLVQYLVCTCECDISAEDQYGNTTLHIACIVNNMDFVQALLEQETCVIGMQNCNGDTPLHIACSQGNSKIVAMLLLQSTSELYTMNNNSLSPFQVATSCQASNHELQKVLVTNMCKDRNEFHNGAFHLACMTNDIQLFKTSAELKFDANLTNIDGDTPLHLACKLGRVELVKMLLGMNCDTNIQNKSGTYAAVTAFQAGHLDILDLVLQNAPFKALVPAVKVLLDNGLDPQHLKYIKFDHATTIFHLLCSVGVHCNVLKALEDSKNNYETRDDNGWTPLHYACYYGNVDIASYLIGVQSCASTVKTIENSTALHLACISPVGEALVLQVVTVLVSTTELDVNEKNGSGLSPLMLAVNLTRNRIAQYLIADCHCDLNTVNGDGRSALHLACAEGNVEVVKMIIQAVEPDFDFDLKDHLGETPLQLACRNNHQDTVSMLLKVKEYKIESVLNAMQCSEDENIITQLIDTLGSKEDEHGNNAMHIVCMMRNSDLARHLVRESHFRNKKNKNGDTPLHLACATGDPDLVDIMLHAHPCDINTQNNKGDKPFHLACKHKNPTVASMLLQIPKIHDVKLMIKKLGIGLYNFLGVELGDQMNVLHLMCGELGDLETLRLTVEGFDCTQYLHIDGHGQTPLHYACIFGHVDIVKFFVTEQNYNPAFTNKWGESLLHVVCDSLANEEKALILASFLITTCNLDCNVTCNFGHTPLMLILRRKPCLITVAKYLIVECQCDLSIQNPSGDTALHLATIVGNLVAVKLLLHQPILMKEKGTAAAISDVDEESSIDRTPQFLHPALNCGLYTANLESQIPLFLAEQLKENEIVAVLIHFMYKYPDENGNTPLHLACMAGNDSLIEKILNMNMKLATTVANKDGDTPLHILVRNGGHKIKVELLLSAGCDAWFRNNQGDTPLHVACTCGNIEAIRAILGNTTHAEMCTEQRNNVGKFLCILRFQITTYT